MSTLLKIDRVTKTFGALVAVNGVETEVKEGEIKGLIGPNGSGKTTLFNVIHGLLKADEGELMFSGRRITGMPTHALAKIGIGRTFQEIQVFGDMTVLENVMVGVHRLSRAGFIGALIRPKWVLKEESYIREKAQESLRFVGLQDYQDELARNLPYGYRRLLEIARCLVSDPALLLLDEPSAGMNHGEAEELLILIERIREAGTTVFLVEHNMRLVMNICDTIAVLNYGSKICEGAPEQVQCNQEVIDAYLGGGTDVIG
jgi:branched-chain amino acid transport system ATP-binding protein